MKQLWDVWDAFLWFSLGAGSRLESVGEDDELMVENGESSYEIAVKYSRGGRKHSLPQQLESAGARQVGANLGMSTAYPSDSTMPKWDALATYGECISSEDGEEGYFMLYSSPKADTMSTTDLSP